MDAEEIMTTGFTQQEQKVMDHLVAAWNCFVELPVQHPSDNAEFRQQLHLLQYLMAARIVRRNFTGWFSMPEEKMKK